MLKKEDAKKILSSLNMPAAQQSDICCYTLLTMSGLNEKSEWRSAQNDWIRIHDIIQFIYSSYGIQYSENSKRTFRKQAINHFRNAAIIEDNRMATNSPNYSYRLTNEFLEMVRAFGSNQWGNLLDTFFQNHLSLVELYAAKNKMIMMPVRVNDMEISFSADRHSQLQKMILEEFAPRFAPFSECLYVGGMDEKYLYKNTDKLLQLGFTITLQDKMPDIVLYRTDNNRLYFIEAVTSFGPIDAKRILEIDSMTEKAVSGKIYVTAFNDFKTFKRFSEVLAWETEVWIADIPKHMVYMGSDKFIGSR